MEKNTLCGPRNADPKPEQKTLSEYLVHQAKHFEKLGRSVFLVDGLSDEKRYFKHFDDETRKIASKFYKNGLRKGDIVIYMSSHQISQVLLIAGVWRANGVARSLYSEEAPSTILQKVLESKARWIFCDTAEAEAVIQQVVNKCDWPVEVLIASSTGPLPPGSVSFDEYIKDDGMKFPVVDVNEDDLALILPTSGTTGPSKGAMLSHKSTLTIIRNFSLLPWTYPKSNIIASKSTHVSGMVLPLSILVIGSTGVVLPKVNKKILIKTVDKYKPGFVFGFPSYLLALGSSDADGFDISSVEILGTGGGTTTEGMRQAFLDIGNVKAVLNNYGLTEGASVSTVTDLSENTQFITYPDCPATSVGRPFPGTFIQIRGLETLEVLGPNQNGEIWTKGDFIFTGYYKNPEATKETLVDGWVGTGDIGYFDDKGYLYVVDRKKDIFKFLNNHISPTELEDVIFMHPLVGEVCVIGVLGKLASYKQLRGGLYIVNDLPRGKTGKVERKLVGNLEIPTY